MADRRPHRTVRDPAPIWRDADFDRYWFGHALSALGDQVSALALPLTAVVLVDATTRQVGLLTAAIWTPSLLSMLVGTWVDRHRRQQRLMIISNLLQAAAVAAVPVAATTGGLGMPVLYAAALALGASGVLYDTSYPSFFVRVVDKAQYVAANSALSTTASIAALIGPAAAGALIDTVSAPDALLVDAATFVVSAVAISTVRLRARRPTGPPTGPEESYLARLSTGVRYLRHHTYLRASLLASASMNVAAFAVQAVIIVYSVRTLGLSPGQIGLALGVGATGALLGAVTAGGIAASIGAGRTMALGVALSVAPFAALTLADVAPGGGVATLAAAELVAAWAIMLFDVNNNALRAVVTDDAMRGRVSGAYATVNYGSRPAGALAGGILGAAIGVPTTFVIAAVTGTLASAWIIFSPIWGITTVTEIDVT